MDYGNPFGVTTPARTSSRPARLEGYDNYPGSALFSGQLEGGFKTPDRGGSTPGRPAVRFAEEPPPSLSRTGSGRSAIKARGTPGLGGAATAGEETDGLPSVSLLDGVNASFLNDSAMQTSGMAATSVSAVGAQAGVGGGGGDQCWVIMFGFPASQTAVVIEEMLSCGQIVSHQSDGPLCNWAHVQFETALGAQRALTRDGAVLERVGLMVGVRRSSGPTSRPRVAHAAPAAQALFLQPRSSYSVTGSHLAYEFAPYAVNSWWSRFKYYILGLW